MRISDWSSDVCSSDLSDNIPPGKKRFQSFQRRLIVGLAVNRHYYGCIANVKVHIAGGNNLPVAPHQTGGGHGNTLQAPGTRPRLSVGIDSRVRVILNVSTRNGHQHLPNETRPIVYVPVIMIFESADTHTTQNYITHAKIQHHI